MMRITPFLNLFSFKWSSSGSPTSVRQIKTNGFPLQFKVSPLLWAEPLKAKKKMDPAIVKAREERKKKKMEKLIKRRLKLDRQLKPVYESEVPKCLIDNPKERERKVEVTEAVKEERIKLLKQWASIKSEERKKDIMLLDRLIYSQQLALNELRLESEELYQAAVKVDEKLIPFQFIGPPETPQLKTYSMPDGEYIDVSKKWT